MMKRTFSLCLVMLLLLPMLLTGCGADLEKTTKEFSKEFGDKRVGYHAVDNERFTFEFIEENKRQVIKLTDKTTGKVYSSVPADYLDDQKEDGMKHPLITENGMEIDHGYSDNILYSPINIKYIEFNELTYVSTIQSKDGMSGCLEKVQYKKEPTLDYEGNQVKNDDGSLAYTDVAIEIDNPRANEGEGQAAKWEKTGVTSEIIENGVRVKYSFEELEISVTVEYILAEDGLLVKIPMDRIEENNNLLYEVEVLPYFVSAAHSAENKQDAYLMLPSGGGALVYAQNKSEILNYDEMVYGADLSAPVTMKKQSTNQVHLPVFGARNGKTYDEANTNTAVIGVLENGAACGVVRASAGDAALGYSGAYASFRVRGEESVQYKTMEGQEKAAFSYSTSIADYDYLSVRYLPVGGNATYTDMAATYRGYLQSKGYLTERTTNAPALSVNLLGGTETRESFFGIPYHTTTTTTSLEQSLNISKELKKLVGNGKLLVTLEGYGNGGLSDTEVAGGFEVLGDEDELAAFLDYAKKNNIVVSMDYDTVQFNESGSGFSTGDDVAYTISQLDAQLTAYVLNTAVQDEDIYWYLLARGSQKEAVEKAIESAKENGFSSISFSALSNMAYSDYHDAHYTAKAHTDEEVAAFLKECAKNGLTVVSPKANDYAALNAEYVTNVPMQSSKFTIFDEEIPFYSLVFQGYKALSSATINTAVNVENAYLKAVATGSALQFTLCDTLHDSLRFEQNTAYITSRYSDWKGDITKMVNDYKAIHDKVGNMPIVDYVQMNGMSKTVFSDGAATYTVYVNYTDDAMIFDGVTVEGGQFVLC